jgi:hypothetical protein
MRIKVGSKLARTALETSRWGGLSVAAALFLGTCSVDIAAATTITYSSYTWIGDDIQINSPNHIFGGAGQITLDTSSGNILAWCLDVTDYLLSSGTYSVSTPATLPQLSAAQDAVIGSLIVEGNALLAGQGINGYNKDDISTAVQIAIWQTEYGASFSYTPINSSVTQLVQDFLLPSGKWSYENYFTATFETLNPPNGTANQVLAMDPVPGPVAGAGLPGLLFAAGGFLARWRSRRRGLAEVAVGRLKATI